MHTSSSPRFVRVLSKCLEHSRRNFGICFLLCHIKITNSFEWMILIVSELHTWNIPEQNPWYMWRLPCWVISRRRVTRNMRTMSTKDVNRAVQDRWPLWLFRLNITVIIIITVFKKALSKSWHTHTHPSTHKKTYKLNKYIKTWKRLAN